MFSTDFIFRQQENFVDNQKCQAGFRPLCNKILFLYIFLIFSFKVARRCLSFLHNGVQELSILDINCPQGSVACWVLLSALEVLQTCRDFSQNSTSTQVQQYCFYTAELWSYCREKMLLLGKLIVFTLYITLLNGLHKESNCFSKIFLSDFSFEIVECASIVLQNRKSMSIYLCCIFTIRAQSRRKVWKSGGASSNKVGIIFSPGLDRVNC